MKKNVERISLALALPLVAGFVSSCQDYELADSASKINEIGAKEEFTESFINRYGEMDPNHTWGFGDIMGDGETRAQVAEKNMWDEQYHMVVPGWPDIYYTSAGQIAKEDALYHNISGSTNVYSATEGSEPAGDVTDEEIQYVSCWFRTHRNPGSTEIHWSDFWIQEISSDMDRDMNGNLINFGARYELKNGAWEHSSYTCSGWGIDQLEVKTFDGTTVPGSEFEGYDHIYNFNHQRSNYLESVETVTMDITKPWGNNNDLLDAGNNYVSAGSMQGKTDTRLIAFYQNSGTEDFMAHYSNDQKWRNNWDGSKIWVLVHLHFTGASGRIYDGYYLGFDYAYYKEENFDGPNGSCSKYSVIYPDGYYSNWIVKLSPGTPITTTTEEAGFSRRVMCEDLGNAYDLDFDDVVFDATYNITNEQLNAYKTNPNSIPTQGIDVTINLQAAGGTMPISVGAALFADGTGNYEAHKLLGQGNNYTIPVNVANGASAPVANYHIKVGSVDPDDIPIYVYNTKIGQLITLNKANSNANSMYKKDGEYAPQKFAVPTSVLWMQETKQIEEGYGHFADWVGNASWSNGNGAWYTDGNVKDQSKLCGRRGAYSATTTTHTTNPITGCTVAADNTPAKLEYRLDSKTNNVDWGTVTATQFITAGQSGTITATPKSGYKFVKWSDGETANPRTVTVTTLTNLMAYFAPEGTSEKYSINVGFNIYNLGYYATGGGQYSMNESVTISVVAGETVSPYYRFSGWEDDATASMSRQITVTGNANYTALFEIDEELFESTEVYVEGTNVYYVTIQTYTQEEYKNISGNDYYGAQITYGNNSLNLAPGASVSLLLENVTSSEQLTCTSGEQYIKQITIKKLK